MANDKSGCVLGWLIGDSGGEKERQGLPEVKVNSRFVTPAEANFYRVLRQTIGESAIVLMQVAMNQLLYFPGSNRDNPGRASWRNRVASRSLDYVLLDVKTMRPVVAIELDEPSHAKPTRQTRDEQVEQVLEAAGLPLVRVLTSRTYSTAELEEVLRPYLGKGQ